jgi:hypothetical protein
MKDKYKNKITFVIIIALFVVVFAVAGMIVNELTDDKPSQALLTP